MRIALFLGAGASVPYGMPTTKDLRDKIRRGDSDFPREDLLDSDRFPDIEHVLSTLDQLLGFMHSPAGQLYEKFIKTAPSEETRDKHSYMLAVERFRTYVEDSQASKEIIERLITQNYKWNVSNNESAEKILRPLFDLAKSRKGHITVFTTNYDTVIEEYCAQPDHDIECVDGFKLHAARRTLIWDGKFSPQNDDFSTKVFLYKLHGSMSWLADDSGDQGSILHKPDTTASDDRARDIYIRPSLDTKGEATQREPYATILRRFEHILPAFDACIVIGYSFRDPHICERLIKFAKAGKTLVVLSPTAAADFRGNALNEKSTYQDKGGWSGKFPRQITLESSGKRRDVHIINRKLDGDDMDGIIDRIRSAINDDPSYHETDAGTGAGSGMI